MAQFEPLLWERHPRRLRRRRVESRITADIDAGCEFAGPPLGRLGRRLLADVESYLEFFALAHQPTGQTQRTV
jgi:hypothetical protein